MAVRDAVTDELATLYADPDRVQPIANPTATDGFGNLAFYIDPGIYKVSMVGSTYYFKIVVTSSEGGSGGGAASFEFVQNIPQSVWTVNHNLGFRPSAVSIFSIDFATQYDDFAVQHVTANQLLISMDVPTAGRALM